MSENIDCQFLAKISTGKMGITQDTIRENLPKSGAKPVMRVYGMVTNVKYGSTDKGEWTRFDGQIEAVNMLTGEVFRSGSLFLPPAVTPIVEGQLIAAKNKEGFIGLQVAYEIRIKKSAVPIGYEYDTVNLIKGTAETDPLIAMRESFAKALPKK